MSPKLSRRSFLRTIGFGAAALGTPDMARAARDKAKGPNILMVVPIPGTPY